MQSRYVRRATSKDLLAVSRILCKSISYSWKATKDRPLIQAMYDELAGRSGIYIEDSYQANCNVARVQK